MPTTSALSIPDLSLVVLVGISGSGKSTFAAQHFLATEVLSSDTFRGLVADDEGSLEATADAFDALRFLAAKRLANRRLTVVDATNVQPTARAPLVELAKAYHAMPVAVVFDMPEDLCWQRSQARPDRQMDRRVIGRQHQQLRRALKRLKGEGFRRVWVLTSPEQVASVTIERERLWTDRRDDSGPFDIVGDVHGCFDELCDLLRELGYTVADGHATPPAGRRALFLGDLVDRGPATAQVLELVMAMEAEGHAVCVPGNHDVRLARALRGRKVKRTHGLSESLSQLEAVPPAFRSAVADFLEGQVSHFVLDEGRLVVAHAGMRQDLAGRASAAVRSFALYGDVTGAVDDFGLPVRGDWAADYRGGATVVYGHTPVARAEWLNETINLDTGCVFGGRLTALRYPERELVSVAARQTYAESVRPFLEDPPQARSAQQAHDDLLDLADVSGRRRIETTLMARVTIRAEQAAAALQVMSRWAVDPKWLVYLPPTMAPGRVSADPAWLEHPREVFGEYRDLGVDEVVCEEKHMGSRAVVVLCRDEDAARERFGVTDGRAGICYTRTGRPFFDDEALARGLIDRLRAAAKSAGLWESLDTTWIVLDGELLPWSAKALPMIRSQYAAVGAAARMALGRAEQVLAQAAARGADVIGLLERNRTRAALVERYRSAYGAYCWHVAGLDDLRFAPFHLLASETGVHADRDHLWHMDTLGRLCAADPAICRRTDTRHVILADDDSVATAVSWWEGLTESGGEGMVVKPKDFVVHGKRGLLQPGIKCRGREYLRIIYGPEYTGPERLRRLKQRNTRAKGALALREFALGLEALERLVSREPLRRVHECVFGVLALESEPVDPRL